MREPRAAAATAVAVVVSVVGIVALTASSPAVLQQLMPALDLSGARPCARVPPALRQRAYAGGVNAAAVVFAPDDGGTRPPPGYYAQQPARTQMLPQFQVNGGLEVPDHPPGMKYVKTDPMGSFEVTSPDGNSLGKIRVRGMRSAVLRARARALACV